MSSNLKRAYDGLSSKDKTQVISMIQWIHDMGQYMKFWKGPSFDYPTYIECDIQYLKEVWQREYQTYNQIRRNLTKIGIVFVESLDLLNKDTGLLNHLISIMISEINCDIYLKADDIINSANFYLKLLG